MAKTLPKFLCGGISAGEWNIIDRKTFAETLYLSRCNNVVLEVMAPAYGPPPTGYSDKTLENIYAELKKFIDPILTLDMWVTLHLANGGDEMITHFGAQNIADKIVGPLLKDFGTNSKIIICPIAESHGEPNEDQLVQYCLKNWGGAGGYLIYNGSGRPNSLPGGYSLLDYHTQSGSDFGPTIGRMSLIDTDNGPIISYLTYAAPPGKYWNTDRVISYGTGCKQVGNGLNLYAYQTKNIDATALNALGKVYGVRSKPNWWDKLMMKFKLWKYK